MKRSFAEIAFTPDVLAAQAQAGTRAHLASLPNAPAQASVGSQANLLEISVPVAAWLQVADSFFIATVGSNGWPYIQHRGGQAGMIRLLDAHHFAFDDVAGNGQLITVGNLRGNDRVMLFLIDYENARRLKLWGRAVVQDTNAGAADYEQAVRTVTVALEAASFNCSAFIPSMARF